MRVDEFDFELPPGLIAQLPPERRDGGRLMVLDRRSGEVCHRTIGELPDLLAPGSLLVVNDTRVIPARVRARRASGGQVELLFLERLEHAPGRRSERWACMLRSSKTPRQGEALGLPSGESVSLVTGPSGGRCEVSVEPGVLLRHGSVPLPPYIRRPDTEEDRARYQTVFAREDGSVAAPTAGLHFTDELIDRVRGAGVEVQCLTLHVGPGTFQPVRVEDLEEHQMEDERFQVPEETADAIRRAKAEGRPVVAVGTTVVRTLESTGGEAGAGRTELFITPGHPFRVVDRMLTNFHLPRSTLLMLVAAFAGRERVLAAYARAVEEEYRFYSYGDAMYIR